MAVESMPPPGWAPRPPAVSRPPANRRRLDSRRFLAYLIDAILLGGVSLLLRSSGTVTEGAWLLFLAFQLIYFFLCEATTGQTIGKRKVGLRVVQADGRPAAAGAIATRTVLRLIDATLIGPLALVLSGERRQRIGDLAARTIVTEAAPDPGRPPKSALLYAYPIGWVALCVVAIVSIGHRGDVYLSNVDRICHSRQAYEQKLPQPLTLQTTVVLQARQLAVIRRLDRASHQDEAQRIESIYSTWLQAVAGSAADLSAVQAATDEQRTGWHALGLDACAA